MLDDVFALSNCGPQTAQMDAFIDIKTNYKKLQFALEKTYKMNIGKSQSHKNTKRNGKGKEIRYHTLRMQNYLSSEDENINNEERK